MIDTLEFWHWWIAALALAAIEAVVPGASFLWLGGAAFVVGMVLFAFPDLSWQIQALFFALLSIGAVLSARFFWRRMSLEGPDTGTLNRRSQRYVGMRLTLETGIVNGRGRAFVGDSSWTVEGPDLPAGATVRVVSADGVVLYVEQA
jgi:membrane protein implicated in regulation of membrane protease activity